MIGLCQTDLTTLLFQLIDSKDARNILENEGWRTNSVNNPTDKYDVSYNEFKLSKYIDLSEGNSSRCYFTIKEYSTYSNIITLKIYDKSFYNQFEKIIINSAYKKTSQDVASNIIQTVYKKTPLEITFKEVLNNYYQITLLNYKHGEQKAQTFYIFSTNESAFISQEEEDDEDEVFMVVETMPVFPGGDLGLMRFIQKTTKYPAIAKENDITGKVIVTYVVNKKGKVTGVKVLRGVDRYLDAEAVRVVKLLPYTTAGTQRGKPVIVQFTVPFNFTLN